MRFRPRQRTKTPWMKKADEILDDEKLIETVYEALR